MVFVACGWRLCLVNRLLVTGYELITHGITHCALCLYTAVGTLTARIGRHTGSYPELYILVP